MWSSAPKPQRICGSDPSNSVVTEGSGARSLRDSVLAFGVQTFGSHYSDRCRPPSETVAHMRRLLAEFGITRLARLTGLDHLGVPVWSAIRPNSRTLAQSQGKGVDDPSAMASAVMEAVEVATAERDDLPSRRGTRSEFRAAGWATETADILLRGGAEPLGENDETNWLEGEDLLTGVKTLVPYEAVAFSENPEAARYWQSSDGLASGNTIWEAVLHGLCERIERDASTLWLLRTDDEIRDRCVDPSSFDDPVVDALIARVDRAGLQMRLFDASCDTGVPVYGAFLSPIADGGETDWKHFDLSSGWGSHPTPLRAALRALTEAAQTRLTTISAARDDFNPRRYYEPLHPDLLVYPRSIPRRIEGLEAGAGVEPDRLLPQLLGNLARVGVPSVIAVPLEQGARGFAVARVLVTGLESPPGDRTAPYGARVVKFAQARR